MGYPEEYMNQTVVFVDNGTFIGTGFVVGSGTEKNIRVRWDDFMMEAVDINDEYVLATAKVITNEPVYATYRRVSINPKSEKFYFIKDGERYRILQHRVMHDIDGNELYRELLVGPVAAK